MPSPLGILDSLTPDQQDQLLVWMETLPAKTVLEKVAADPPAGFGLKTHLTSLRRFYARKQTEAAIHDLQLARDRLASDPAASTDFQKAALSALMQRAFQLTVDSELNRSNFRAVASWLSTLLQQEVALARVQLARERLALQKQKLAFDAKCKAAGSGTEYQESKINEAIAHYLEKNTPA